MTGRDWILIGAGGHARAVVEGLVARGERIAAYVDPQSVDWLPNARRIAADADADPHEGNFVLGVGGLTVAQLRRRVAILEGYLARGATAPGVVHPTAIVSPSAVLEPGAMVLAGAIVQPNTRLARGAIVNTGAIVEHDCVVEEGAHVAPGAVVLGGCRVGAYAIVGTRSVVLPGLAVPAGIIVRAGDVFQLSSKETTRHAF